MAELRETPYSVFNYLINFDDGTEGSFEGGCSEVSGLGMEITLAEYRNGNAKANYVTKVPAIHKAGDVTLKRGVIGSQKIYEWFEEIRNGDVNAKRNVVITLLNENPSSPTAVLTWTLVKAIPLKWEGPTLTAKGGTDVAIESFTLSPEFITQA